MNKQVEVEGGELALQNSNGDIAIIPKKYRREVEDMIKDNCHNCLDNLIATLPKASDYAEGGSLYEVPEEIPFVEESIEGNLGCLKKKVKMV